MDNTLIQQYLVALDSIINTYNSNVIEFERVSERTAHGIIPRARTAVEKISGKRSHYTRQMEAILAEESHIGYKAEQIIGIVEGLRADIQHGFLSNFSEVVRGELFQDFVDMATYLCQEGFKDAAASITGGTLEIHLRRLCHKHSIDSTYTMPDGSVRPKKASQLNQELGKVAYSLFDQKQVTAWLDLRNSAAHGKYTEYNAQQAMQFIDWLRDFMVRNPA